MNKEHLKKIKGVAFRNYASSSVNDPRYFKYHEIFWKLNKWYEMLYLAEDFQVPAFEGDLYMP